MTDQIETTKYTPKKSKQIALARLDLIHKWLEFRRLVKNKMQADYDFVKLHNTSNSYLFEILGKISRGSLHRWYSMLNGTEDYTKLLPQYKYATVNEYRTTLTDEEIKILMGLLLHPNRICIGKAIALTKYKLKEQGQSFIPSDITFRRYAKWFKDNNYDKWVLARDGEKALSDKVEPYIKTLRDIHDETNCPIIFIGMGLAHRKLERYKHLFDRFSEIVKFETFGVNDLKQIFDQLAEVKLTPDAIEYIHKKYNRFRQLVQLINQLEIIANENNLEEITLEIIKEIL